MYQVRDGKRVVPTCPECGCRLRLLSDHFMVHYQTHQMGYSRDARGCKCSRAMMARIFDVGIWSTGPHWNPA